jgi:hypothetical protein
VNHTFPLALLWPPALADPLSRYRSLPPRSWPCGALREGVHIAGYTFERACSNLKWLVQEDRWKLGGRFSKPAQFMDSLQLGEFRQTAEERKEIAKFIRQTLPEVSNQSQDCECFGRSAGNC